jgi:glycine/serine hydroxymethyltransferase
MKYEITSDNTNHDAEPLDYANIEAFFCKIKHDLIICDTSSRPSWIDFKILVEDIDARFMANVTHISTFGCTNTPNVLADATTTHKIIRNPHGSVVVCNRKYANVIYKMRSYGTLRGLLMHVNAEKTTHFCETLSNECKEHIKRVAKNRKTFTETLMNNSFRFIINRKDNHICSLEPSGHGTSCQQTKMSHDKIRISTDKNVISHRHPLSIETWKNPTFWNCDYHTTVHMKKGRIMGERMVFPRALPHQQCRPFYWDTKKKRKLQLSVCDTHSTLKFDNKNQREI